MIKKAFWIFLFCACAPCLSAQTLRIATYQYANNNRIGNIQPFADHLQKKYSPGVTVKSYPTVHALIEGIQQGEVDIALINTFGYLLLETTEKKCPMEPVLTLELRKDAEDNYKTAIIASANSPINQLADLEKHAVQTRLMLVAKGSTSGNLVPRLAFNSVNLTNAEKNFKFVQYAGTHLAAIESILIGQADLAAMGHAEYVKMIQKDSSNRQEMKLVWLSPEIPLGPVLLHKKINPSTRDLIIKAFLDLHNEEPVALESVKAGWSEAKQASHYIHIKDSFYDAFRKTLGRKKDLQRILMEFAN